MAKRLEYLAWKPFWVSHLGCIKGALEWLDRDVSDAWLFGGTGHAFVINVHEIVCPSGPTAWNTERLFALGRNVGYAVDGVFSRLGLPDFEDAPRRAWDFLRSRLDENVPCFAWELALPEFYVVNGYEGENLFFSGPAAPPKASIPWSELGRRETKLVEAYAVQAGPPSGEAETLREAVAFALEHAKNPETWIFPGYRSGPEAFAVWAASLEAGTADPLGAAYNAAVWSECRAFAFDFLEEARDRLEGRASGPLEEAAGRYRLVARGLKRVSELFPFHTRKPSDIVDESRRSRAAAVLREVKTEEEKGLAALARVAEEI